jgi:F-type H+-transporting ATPase subunit epsilon
MARPDKIHLEIVTPARLLVSADVDEIVVPGADGYLGILPGHTPLLASLQAGELWYRQGNDKHYLAVLFGYVEVRPDGVTILANGAEAAEEIDVTRAEAAKKRAEEALSSATADMDIERARIALLRSIARLRVAERQRVRH